MRRVILEWLGVTIHRDVYRHRSSVVEHTLGKGEVTGSNPVGGSRPLCGGDDRCDRQLQNSSVAPLGLNVPAV